MVYLAIISLILGVLSGYNFLSASTVDMLGNISEYTLYILMFSVGISIGRNKDVFNRVKEYHLKIFVVPFGIITASLIGGLITALIFGMPVKDGVSIASGLGWYSLSGVMLSELAGPTIGTIAFLSNLLREIISFMSIPFIARRFNHLTAIAPAAATSEDTTLPMMIKYTSEDVVIVSVFNGFICSTLVPILIKFFYSVL